jgi:hypothetical protein
VLTALGLIDRDCRNHAAMRLQHLLVALMDGVYHLVPVTLDYRTQRPQLETQACLTQCLHNVGDILAKVSGPSKWIDAEFGEHGSGLQIDPRAVATKCCDS